MDEFSPFQLYLNFLYTGEDTVHRACLRDKQLLIFHRSHDCDLRSLHPYWNKVETK